MKAKCLLLGALFFSVNILFSQCVWSTKSTLNSVFWSDTDNWDLLSGSGCGSVPDLTYGPALELEIDYIGGGVLEHNSSTFFANSAIININSPLNINGNFNTVINSGSSVTVNINAEFNVSRNFVLNQAGTVNINVDDVFDVKGETLLTATGTKNINLLSNSSMSTGDLIIGRNTYNNPDFNIFGVGETLIVKDKFSVVQDNFYDITANISAVDVQIQNNGTLNMSGDLIVSGDFVDESGSPRKSKFGNIDVEGDFTIDNNAGVEVSGIVDVGGDLLMSSSTGSTFNGDVNVDGSFTAEGNSTTIFGSTLDVGVGTTITGGVVELNDESDLGTLFVNGGDLVSGTSSSLFVHYDGVADHRNGQICGLQPESTGGGADLDNPFDLGNCLNGTGVLPIELSYFTVVKTSEGFQYNWETFTEIDNDNFVIEYSSDLKVFNELGTVSGAGTSFESIDYEYLSNDWFVRPQDSVVYFRLKQVDFDGTFTYSHVVAVTLVVENILVSTFELFPNPANDVVKIQFPTGTLNDDSVIVNILNVLTNNRSIIEMNTLDGEYILDVSHLPTGLYVVNVEGVSQAVKLVVQR